ncbi:MAG: AI-2E family transporter, partial [bacterium]
IVDDSRRFLPLWVVDRIPSDAESLRIAAVDWLKGHAAGLQTVGETAGRILAYILFGMIIGGMISLRRAETPQECGPLAKSLTDRIARLSLAFHKVVFAQVRIAAINAFLTGLYLVVILPLAGISLPFTKTLVAVTFVLGLMPVVGNLISNAFIVVLSLSCSLPVAAGSLTFLVVIHKLEYFLNARIVGSRIRAHAWEILIAMLIMEVLFGIYGLIAAPIYYAYIKDELYDGGLI